MADAFPDRKVNVSSCVPPSFYFYPFLFLSMSLWQHLHIAYLYVLHCCLVPLNQGWLKLKKRKGKVNVRFECFRPVASSRQNHCRQVDPTQACCLEPGKIDDSGFDWKVCLGVRACVWVKTLWPVIDWPLDQFGSAGSRVVENQKRGWRKSMISLKHRCVDWQMNVDCE